ILPPKALSYLQALDTAPAVARHKKRKNLSHKTQKREGSKIGQNQDLTPSLFCIFLQKYFC
ncbi:MAG: hypothetical protein RSD27_11045, partial [Ruthenibacterium sp.]